MPQEKAAKDSFDINVGTSFGYNKKTKSRFPSFAAVDPEPSSSYSNPITSYDAPIAPSSYQLQQDKSAVRKLRKVKKEKYTDPTSLSTIPYGNE